MSDRADVAWAAGVFEGEGSICTRTGHSVSAQMSMTDFDVIERFYDVMGFGAVYGPIKMKPSEIGTPRKDQLQWKSGRFEDVQALIAMFWPWLGERRRQKAREVLAFAVGARTWGRSNPRTRVS